MGRDAGLGSIAGIGRDAGLGDDLLFEIHRDGVGVLFRRVPEHAAHGIAGQHDGEQSVLEAVVVEDVREGRRDDHAKAVVLQS